MAFTAPDLWHVRSFVARVGDAGAAPVAVQAGAAQVPQPSISEWVQARLAPLRSGVAAARAALADRPDAGQQRELWRVLTDLADALIETGQVEQARTTAQEALERMRQLAAQQGQTPPVLRDLSVSWEKVGDAESAAGRGAAALTAYRQGLALSEQLRQALGDTPQVLDDLAVSLERVAASEHVALAERRLAAADALHLRRQLVAALPDAPRWRQRLQVAEALAARLPDNGGG